MSTKMLIYAIGGSLLSAFLAISGAYKLLYADGNWQKIMSGVGFLFMAFLTVRTSIKVVRSESSRIQKKMREANEARFLQTVRSLQNTSEDGLVWYTSEDQRIHTTMTPRKFLERCLVKFSGLLPETAASLLDDIPDQLSEEYLKTQGFDLFLDPAADFVASLLSSPTIKLVERGQWVVDGDETGTATKYLFDLIW